MGRFKFAPYRLNHLKYREAVGGYHRNHINKLSAADDAAVFEALSLLGSVRQVTF